MNTANIIPIEILIKLLRADFDAGNLYWLPRTVDMLSDKGNGKTANMNTFNAKSANKEAFTASKCFYRIGRIFGKNFKRSRVIFALYHGKWPENDIDHINQIRDDDRIVNLREVTHQENMRNIPMLSTNTSGVTGVGWYKPSGKWKAQIQNSGKGIYLGYFRDKQDAIAARKEAEIEYGFHKNHGQPKT